MKQIEKYIVITTKDGNEISFDAETVERIEIVQGELVYVPLQKEFENEWRYQNE